jgi:hypothetical protein
MLDYEREVLDLLSEDYYGLWEIRIQVGGNDGHLVLALRDLLDRRLISWHFREDDRSVAIPVEPDAEVPSLDDPEAWLAPALDEPHYLLTNTPEGDAQYYRG